MVNDSLLFYLSISSSGFLSFFSFHLIFSFPNVRGFNGVRVIISFDCKPLVFFFDPCARRVDRIACNVNTIQGRMILSSLIY